MTTDRVTRVPVLELGDDVTTAEERGRPRSVVVATNAFTSELLPEIAIVPYQSQVMVTEDVDDRTRGRIVTGGGPGLLQPAARRPARCSSSAAATTGRSPTPARAAAPWPCTGCCSICAGEAAASLALTGEAPPWLDEGVSAPTRLAAR